LKYILVNRYSGDSINPEGDIFMALKEFIYDENIIRDTWFEKVYPVEKMMHFDPKLYAIGQLSDPEEKSIKLKDRYDLAVNALTVWHFLQLELREEKGVLPLEELIADELKEVEEKKGLELELARDMSERYLPWYKRNRASEYWEVANEMADVMVLVVSKMLTDGMSEAEVSNALRGDTEHPSQDLMNEMIARTSRLGMNLAEIMILKTEVNLQHRDPSLEAWVRGNHFMKRIRHEIGNEDSQIPHMAQGFLGETVLTRLQSPIYATGRCWEWLGVYSVVNIVNMFKESADLPSIIDDKRYGDLYRENSRLYYVVNGERFRIDNV